MTEKVEKLASSEIAQSRARFEGWCPITITNIDKAPKTAALKSAYWTAWQAAEQDTRERSITPSALLQLLHDAGWHIGDGVDDCAGSDDAAEIESVRILAERIRGKE